MNAAEVCEIVEAKVGPLRERITAEFHQYAEYIAEQEHERIKRAYWSAQADFSKKYGVDKSDYDRCYDVFGTLRNKEYLAQIKAAHKAQQAERERWRSYQESWRSTYSSGGYSIPSVSTYSGEEKAVLKEFYRKLSKLYHPDLNPDKDTTAQMQVLNKLKEHWGV